MSIENDPIVWSDIYQAYTGLRFSIRKDDCRVFVPNYKHIYHTKIPSLSGTEMTFRDEFSSHAFVAAGSTEKLDGVLLRNLWEYAEGNILWDEFNEKLSFKDIEVDEVSLEDFVKDLDSFLVFHKLTKFGNVWWHKRVTTDMQGSDTDNANVWIKNGDEALIKFWSADKYVNDEYKKYLSNPAFYNGFFTSDDFNQGGWFTVPDLTISTKPFEKLKIAQVLLNLNFTFDPRNLGQYYAIDSTLGARIKDLTSNSLLDSTQVKTGQNDSAYTETVVNHWIGGLVSTDNLQTLGDVGKFVVKNCEPQEVASPRELSHLIAAQITLNPDFNPQHADALGTIDPINWRSSEEEINSHKIGILNTDRAFGGSNGSIDGGLVFGGVQNDNGTGAKVVQTVEIWDGDGFLKNVQTQANVPRCFHIQGGFGSKSLVALGGYTRFNTDDYIQFGEYGKGGVRNDLEVFVKSDDPLLSYFKTVPTFKLNTQRGDFAGALSVSTQDRQDRYEAEEALKGFRTGKDDEQRVADFIRTQSGASDNVKRYSIITVQGIAFAGSSSGKSYLTSTGSTDILDTFEKINTIFIDVGVSNTSLAIAYSTVDANLKYPVPCHGLVYVGDENSGLATGGRCELNTISEVESQLIEKYSTGYSVDIDFDATESDLKKSRVLDLVYEYDGVTWTRKQNLLESVYYHCGVGDESHAIFWGGIHDSLANYSFSVAPSSAELPEFAVWGCEDARDIIAETLTYEGKTYNAAVNSSACWTTPTWETSVSALLRVDNPSYKDSNGGLKYGRDADFPAVNILSLEPAGTKTYSVEQTYSQLNFVYPTTSSLDVSAGYSGGASFNVKAQALENALTSITGSWAVAEIISHYDDASVVYPSDIAGAISGETKRYRLTSISLNGEEVNFNYTIQHTFTYVSTTGSKAFALNGTGTIAFTSLSDIWNNGIVPNVAIETADNTMNVVSTASANPTATYTFNGTAKILFSMTNDNGVLIGVKTSVNSWSSTFEKCGSGIASLLNINASLGSGQEDRWGVPMWSAGLNIPATVNLKYGFNVYEEDSDGNVGEIHHEITTVAASAGTLAAILSDRVLVLGTTKSQDHSYIAVNSASVPTVSGYCETLTQNILSITTPITSDAGSAYTEYATSFVQEYRNDKRYKVPEIWIPSNGFNIRPENTGTLYKSSSWKRYMDGVGLGGDAPNYDTIYDSNNEKYRPLANWDEIGSWHVGQMAFGTPQRAVIVGGHKVPRSIISGGLHAGETTKRVFVWDFVNIPEEDSFLTNYKGRRFYTYYTNDASTTPISGNENKSDLNCIIFDAESPIVVERFGTGVFDGSGDSVSVTFDKPMPSEVGSNYSISLTPSDNVEVWWEEKTESGFTIKVELKEWKGQVDFLATTVIKVQEKDIEEKGSTEGYIFEK